MTFKAMRTSLLRHTADFCFKTPIQHLAALVLAASIVVGIASLTEPAWSLRFRRGLRPWKVAPLLCGAQWFQRFADTAYRAGEIPSVTVLLLIARTVLMVLMFPFVAFVKAVSNPAIARSVIVLVGLPTTLLSLCCRLPSRVSDRLPGANIILTWILTASLAFLCTLHESSQAVLHWAVSGVSMQVYLALLAAVLTGTVIQERLTVQSHTTGKPGKKKVCNQHTKSFALYMLAAVTALWIIQSSDSKHAALDVLRNVHLMRPG